MSMIDTPYRKMFNLIKSEVIFYTQNLYGNGFSRAEKSHHNANGMHYWTTVFTIQRSGS